MALMRYLPLVIFLFLIGPVATVATAQSASSGQEPADDQNEAMIDTLKRMQIKREEQEHQKLLDKGVQVQQDAESLKKEAVGNSLPRESEKKLREIEKAARNIRSGFGGGGGDDEALEASPTDLNEALTRLIDASDRLNKDLSKTSRRVISVSVVEVATEITQLVKIIRGYLF